MTRPGVAGGLQSGQQAALDAGGIDGHGGAVALGQLVSLGGNVLLQAVDGVGCAVLLGLFQLGVVDIGDDDGLGVVQLDDAQDGAAQSAAADDHDGVLALQLSTAAALHSNGGGLDHDRLFVAQDLRHQIAVAVRHSHVLAVAAVDVHTAHLQVAADVGTALAAGIAVAAGGDLIDDDAVAHLHAGHALADLLNDAHVLVADDAGIGGSGIGAMIDAHVGAADTGSDHADQNIVFLVDLRLLEINDLQFIRFNDLNALHKIFLLKSDNGLKDFDDFSARWADGSGPC